MSYILDALKKSEQKRRQGTVPDLLTVHDGEPLKAGKRAWLPYVLIGILLLSVGAVLPWLYNKYSGTPHTTGIQVAAPLPEHTPPAVAPPFSNTLVQHDRNENNTQDAIRKQTPAQPPIAQKVQQKGKEKSPKAVQVTARSAEAPSVNAPIPTAHASLTEGQLSSKRVTLKEHELPPTIQQELPKMTISTHIYDADPSARLIIIHHNVIHEGEEVAAGLRLESITTDGVILSYKGYRFYRPLF